MRSNCELAAFPSCIFFVSICACSFNLPQEEKAVDGKRGVDNGLAARRADKVADQEQRVVDVGRGRKEQGMSGYDPQNRQHPDAVQNAQFPVGH